MKPSDVYLWRGVLPLIDTFGRAETELAGALLVIACIANGDQWRPVAPETIGRALDEALGRDPNWQALNRNPFVPNPDFRGLVKQGFASFRGDQETEGTPVEFTEQGLAVLSAKGALAYRGSAT